VGLAYASLSSEAGQTTLHNVFPKECLSDLHRAAHRKTYHTLCSGESQKQELAGYMAK